MDAYDIIGSGKYCGLAWFTFQGFDHDFSPQAGRAVAAVGSGLKIVVVVIDVESHPNRASVQGGESCEPNVGASRVLIGIGCTGFAGDVPVGDLGVGGSSIFDNVAKKVAHDVGCGVFHGSFGMGFRFQDGVVVDVGDFRHAMDVGEQTLVGEG